MELDGIANKLGLTCEDTIYGDVMCESWNYFERNMAQNGQGFGEWSGDFKDASDEGLQPFTEKTPGKPGVDAVATATCARDADILDAVFAP